MLIIRGLPPNVRFLLWAVLYMRECEAFECPGAGSTGVKKGKVQLVVIRQ